MQGGGRLLRAASRGRLRLLRRAYGPRRFFWRLRQPKALMRPSTVDRRSQAPHDTGYAGETATPVKNDNQRFMPIPTYISDHE
jgi:hypothetical protein